MALIFWASAQPGGAADIPEAGRILAHLTEYAVLTALWAWALAPVAGRRALGLAMAIAFAYAITDEFHQSFVEGRNAGPFDVFVDTAGIALAAALLTRQSWSTARS